MTRIALFTDSDVFAGTERHILDLAVALLRARQAVSVYCPTPSPLAERLMAAGVPVVDVQKRGRFDWKAVAILRTALRDGRLDVIHAHNGRTAMLAAVAVALAGTGRWVMTQHFLHPARGARRGVKRIISAAAHGWMNRRVARVIAISEAVKQAILARNDVPPERVIVVPNGLSIEPLDDAEPVAALRERLGLPVGVPLVACVARLAPEKDIKTLVAAMASVTARLPEAICAIAGEGTERAALERQISQLGLGRNVKLLGYRTDARDLICAADLFVLPSLAEPFGLVLLEAMAMGKPVVATRAGGPCEIVCENETGLLTPPGDSAAMANAIEQLLSDPHAACEMGRRGRARFVERFTADRMAQAMVDVYRLALNDDSAPAATEDRPAVAV